MAHEMMSIEQQEEMQKRARQTARSLRNANFWKLEPEPVVVQAEGPEGKLKEGEFLRGETVALFVPCPCIGSS